MSFFHATLESLASAQGLTQAELARRAKISSGDMSKYFNGARPESEALSRLAAAFETGGPDLVAAWLRDEVPDSMRKEVTVTVAAAKGKPSADDDLLLLLQQFGPSKRKVFVELIKRSAENPALLPLLQQVLNATEP
jgi:transcriptional regulator with XRE-family HTH domain